jgi:hypothetical protein
MLLFYYIPSTTALCETIAAIATISVALNMVFMVILIILLILAIRSRCVTHECIEKQIPLDKVSKVEIIKSVEEIFIAFPANKNGVISPNQSKICQSTEQKKESRYLQDQQSHRDGDNDQLYEHMLPSQSFTPNLMAQLSQNIIKGQTNTKTQQIRAEHKEEEDEMYQDQDSLGKKSQFIISNNFEFKNCRTPKLIDKFS